MKTISGLIVYPEFNLVHFATLENDFDKIKERLGFSLADIVERQINGKYFDVVCDDEGLLKNSPLPSALVKDTHDVMLYGPLFLCHHNKAGNLTSAKEEEFDDVKLVQISQRDNEGEIIRRMLTIELDY